MKGFENLTVTTVPTAGGSTLHCHHSDPSSLGDKPVLVLLHGWPQSKFMFRHVLPRLTQEYRVLVPDLPGYGESTAARLNDKRSVGLAVLEAAATIFGTVPIVFVCHDRGARVAQATASHWPEASKQFPGLELRGTCLLDIAPIHAQWASMADPRVAGPFFHWAFLAWPSISTPMIKAYGGDKWAVDNMRKTRGVNEEGLRLFEADGAVEHYAAYHARDVTIEASAADYTAGATEDWEGQVADQESGDQNRKIGVPTLIIYAERSLGRGFPDMQATWRPWVREGVALECVGVGDGVGHYIPEEAPEAVLGAVLPWLAKL